MKYFERVANLRFLSTICAAVVVVIITFPWGLNTLEETNKVQNEGAATGVLQNYLTLRADHLYTEPCTNCELNDENE